MAADQNVTDQKTRTAQRRRALLSARVVYGDGTFTLHATIRNISATGAMVNVPKRQHIPDRVFLLDLKAMIAYDAKVIWRGVSVIGFIFITKYPIGELAGTNLEYLCRIWMDAGAR